MQVSFNHRDGAHIEVQGARIYAESIGPSDGSTLVLLHGGFGNMEDFNGLLPSLAGWRLVGIDSRGHGKSTLGDSPWTYQRVQEDVEHVLQSLGVRRCSVLGFSDGGTVALRLAVSRALTIDRLVVVGSTWHRQNLASSKALLGSVTAESWRRKFPETYDAYQRLNPEPDFERFTQVLKKGWLDETPSGHPDDAVQGIQVPVLVARGDDDPLTQLADAVALRQKLPHAHFLSLPFAGHVAYDDAPEVFQAALNSFLARPDA